MKVISISDLAEVLYYNWDTTGYSIAFSPDGTEVATGTYDRKVKIWKIDQEGTISWNWLGGHTGEVMAVAYHPSGSHIVSGSGDRKLKVWSRADTGIIKSGTETTVSDASNCYKHCRYKAGVKGFYFVDPSASVDPGLCVCNTENPVGCIGMGSTSVTRYSTSDEYITAEFTPLENSVDSMCVSANPYKGQIRPYAGGDSNLGTGGDNPGEDLAARTRACFDACLDLNNEQLIDQADTQWQNVNWWGSNTAYDITAWGVGVKHGRCYCYAVPQTSQAECEAATDEKGTWDTDLGTSYQYYVRTPFPDTKTCTCYSAGNTQITSSPVNDIFQVSSTSTGTLMTVQKNPAVNPSPCNVNSYVALGDDIVGKECNCPIGEIQEAYVDIGFQRSIVNGKCNDYTSAQQDRATMAPLPIIAGEPYNDNSKHIPRCAGDCDSDTDCIGHLKCHQRGTETPLTNDCTGVPTPSTDYCYDPNLSELIPYQSTWVATPSNIIGRCMGDCDKDADCDRGLVCFQRGYATDMPVADDGTSYYNYMHNGYQYWHCDDYQAPRYGPKKAGGRWGIKITDTTDPFYEATIELECAKRCRDDAQSSVFHVLEGNCACGCFNKKAMSDTWAMMKSYTIAHSGDDIELPGCTGTQTGGNKGYDGCVPGEWARVNPFEMNREKCEAACDSDKHCDSYSYAPADVTSCRIAIDCAGFEYKFEGVCDGSVSGIKTDREIGVVPDINSCRDRCAEYKGFLYSENYRRCVCEDNKLEGSFHSTCTPGAFSATDKYSRYQHNFEPAAEGVDAVIYVRQELTTSKGRYCATGEYDLYTVSITDPRADVYACAQEATEQGMEVARGSVNGLTFTCHVSDTYYANPEVSELGIIDCGDFKQTGGPQYILQAGMQRRVGVILADAEYQNKAIKDDLYNHWLYPSDTPEGCKESCDPYKYRHFQFSKRDKTCLCIKKEKSLLSLTGDPNDMEYEFYDFSHGLINSAHEMCYCEGFYLVDGKAKACPAGKYSSKLTPCSAACTTCPIGQFSDSGASECGACVAGQIQTSPISCSKCPAGKYAKAGDISCSQCEIGKYAIGVGAGECTLCPKGKYQKPAVTGTVANNCLNCPAGWEQPNMEQIDCKECGTGKYTTSDGTETCSICDAGKYQDQNKQTSASACHDCPPGRYQNNKGKNSCPQCPSGQYQGSAGKSGCSNCSPGRYRSSAGGSVCTVCSAGKYQGAYGRTSCSSCSAGYYASGNGKTSCTACNHGMYQNQNAKSSCKGCGSLSSGYTWVASPYPHTSEDLSCDQYKGCVWGRATPDCDDGPESFSSGGRDKRACCHYQTNWFCSAGWVCDTFGGGRDATGDARCYSGSSGGFDLSRGYDDQESGRGGWRACDPPAYGI